VKVKVKVKQVKLNVNVNVMIDHYRAGRTTVERKEHDVLATPGLEPPHAASRIPIVFQKALATAAQFTEVLSSQHRLDPMQEDPERIPMTQAGACSLRAAARRFRDPRAQVAGNDRSRLFLDIFIRTSPDAPLGQFVIALCSWSFALLTPHSGNMHVCSRARGGKKNELQSTIPFAMLGVPGGIVRSRR
jgi:hypothetical protein